MSIKTFKIGECANYGIWKVSINNDFISLIGMDWKSKKIRDVRTCKANSPLCVADRVYLHDQMTSFHAETIIDYIRDRMS